MQEPGKNTNHYSTADIQKYLEGKLSAYEMNAMEKAALDDPFLADAIEGMQSDLGNRPPEDFNNDLKELKEKLEKEIADKTRIIAFRSHQIWPRIAAVAILLIGIGFLVDKVLLNNLSSKNKMIANERKTPATDSTVEPDVSPAPGKDSVNINDEVAVNERKKEVKKEKTEETQKNDLTKEATKRKEDENIISDSSVLPKALHYSVSENKEDELRDKVPDTKMDTLKLINANASPAIEEKELNGKAAGINAQSKKNADAKFFTGRVTDENKNPVPGASVTYKNKKTGTVTDQNGNFKLSNPGNDTSTNIIINSVGYQSTSSTLSYNNLAANQIRLKQATSALSEVVVVGYGDIKKRKTDSGHDANTIMFNDDEDTNKETEPAVYNALPIVGIPAYNDYINKNKKINTADSAIRGTEIVSFIIDKNNQLYAFKIKQSLSRAHDAEALRLIKQGPSWRLLKGKKERITLAIEF